MAVSVLSPNERLRFRCVHRIDRTYLQQEACFLFTAASYDTLPLLHDAARLTLADHLYVPHGEDAE